MADWILVLLYILFAGVTVGLWWGFKTDWDFCDRYWELDDAFSCIPVAIFWPVFVAFFAVYGIAHIVALPATIKRKREKARIEHLAFDNRPKN